MACSGEHVGAQVWLCRRFSPGQDLRQRGIWCEQEYPEHRRVLRAREGQVEQG